MVVEQKRRKILVIKKHLNRVKSKTFYNYCLTKTQYQKNRRYPINILLSRPLAKVIDQARN